MKIAVLSGKGGTGKTFVAVNLASAIAKSIYLDCDVEEPNGHLFFTPQNIEKEEIKIKIPFVLSTLCDGSRKCVNFCRFNALAYVDRKLLVFEELCHSCGGCLLVCPNEAIKEKEKTIGAIQDGISEGVRVISGFLNPGEVSGIPIVKGIFDKIKAEDEPVIIDCPPGSACMVMESIKEADYCLLVAEPTTFGVHNLAMVQELVKVFHKPFSIIINKVSDDKNPAKTYCLEQKLPIIAEITYQEEIGRISSDGLILVREKPDYELLFAQIYKSVLKELKR
jgi:MinD superfamily P-loop ATPase